MTTATTNSKEDVTTLQIEVHKVDNLKGFAAYRVGSVKNKKPIILLNIGATLRACIEEDIPIREMLAENLMHEFGHALQEFFNLELTEEFVEKVTETYRQKYGA